MAYEYHIVRQTNYEEWQEEDEISEEEWLAITASNITEAEWRDYIAADAELQYSDADTMMHGSLYCNWLGHSYNKGIIPYFWYHSGTISAKYPTQETLQKMIDIATDLKARVKSDDCEYHDEDGACFIAVKQHWWKFW